MLNKIVIGTANFINPYGILNNGKSLTTKDISDIIECAHKNNMNTFDAAHAYGNFLNLYKSLNINKFIRIMTKFSCLDNYDNLFKDLEKNKDVNGYLPYYGILIHDPQHLHKIEKHNITKFFDKLLKKDIVKKIGISLYDVDELDHFKTIYCPSIIQFPLNPLNQRFISNKFLDYTKNNNIELHARSLFLQGVLLAKKLPHVLNDLSPIWYEYQKIIVDYASALQALITWAKSLKWVDHWVLGFSSFKDLEEVINQIKMCHASIPIPKFDALKSLYHPLVDPRQWKTL